MRKRSGLILGVLVLGVLSGVAPARAEVDREALNKVVAAFVLNFVRYAEWPDDRFDAADDPIVIVVVGETPVLPYLRAIVKDEKVGERPLRVVEAAPPPEDASEEDLRRFDEAVGRAHVAYLNGAAVRAGESMLRRLPRALTVSGVRGFVDRGGMIELYVKDDRVVFDVNQAAMDAAGVKMSSKVLRLAQRVKE